MASWRDFPLPDGSYADETRPWSQQDVVNYLPTIAERNGTRSPVLHKTAPGMKLFAHVGKGPHRGAHNCEGRRFIVSGRKLYQVDKDGVATDRGTIPGTGRVTMAHNQIANGNQVLIGTVDNSYLWDTTTSTLAATGVALQSVDFLNQRFLGVDQQRRFWRHSALADGTSWNDLDVYSSESSPDRIVGLKVLDGQVYVFNERTIEVFVDQPTETQVYQRTVVIQRGCISGDSIVRIAGTLFFVGDDYIPYRLDGYVPVPIGTKPITSDLSGTDPRKLFGFGWEDRGYLVYYITAQNGRTWGYDVTSGKWHRRESYGLDRWRINTLVKFEQDWYAGDYSNGAMYRIEWGNVYEGCEIMPRRLRTGVLHNAMNRLRIHGLSLSVATGQPSGLPATGAWEPFRGAQLLVTGTSTGTGISPFAMSAAVAVPSFTTLDGVANADVAGGVPVSYKNTAVVAQESGGTDGGRYTVDAGATWTTFTTPDVAIGAPAGGPGGFFFPIANAFLPADSWLFDGASVASFRVDLNRPGDSSLDVPMSYVSHYVNGDYWGVAETFFSGVSENGTLTKEWYKASRPSDYSADYHAIDVYPSGEYVFGIVHVGTDAVVAELRRALYSGARSNSGLEFTKLLVPVQSSGTVRPWRLHATGSVVVALSSDGSHMWTSADDWAEPHPTGLSGLIKVPMASNAGRIWIADGTHVVSTLDGITFTDPVPHNVAAARGIVSLYDGPEVEKPVVAPCVPMEGGFFQLRYANDGAENWTDWRDFEKPKTGNFLQPLVVRRLGMARHRVWEVMDTSNTAQDVLAASIIVESE